VIGRFVGSAVTDGGQRIRLLISRRKYPLFFDAVRRSGVIAVNVTEPSTNRSLQLKSTSGEVIEPGSGDFDLVSAYLDLLCADLDRMEQSGLVARTVLQVIPEELAAVLFAPEAAFIQTPGPAAGRRIEHEQPHG
jgi:hypothetical protein